MLTINSSAPLAAECLRAVDAGAKVECKTVELFYLGPIIARFGMWQGAVGVDQLYEALVEVKPAEKVTVCGVGDDAFSFLIVADEPMTKLYGIISVSPATAATRASAAGDRARRVSHPVKLLTAGGEIVEAELVSYYRDGPKRKGTDTRRIFCLDLMVDGKVTTGEESDYFAAMQRLRQKIEPGGQRLLCFGSRRDVWSSGMARSMGVGNMAYLLSYPGTELKPIRSIYDYAPRDTVGTVEEQEAWHEAWVKRTMDEG